MKLRVNAKLNGVCTLRSILVYSTHIFDFKLNPRSFHEQLILDRLVRDDRQLGLLTNCIIHACDSVISIVISMISYGTHLSGSLMCM